MVYPRSIFVLLVAIFSGQLASGQGYRLDQADSVLLLKNGSAMRGHVVRQGDHYIVSFGTSGHARVATSTVDVVCRSLEEAYRHKLSLIDGSQTSRLALARWCLHQKLLSRTADHLLAIEVEHGRSPQVELLHQRLLLAARPSSAKKNGEVSDTASPQPINPEQRLKELPPGTVESFTSHVQPLLLNRCSNAGCHSWRSDSVFALMRPSTARLLTRRMTERNLLAVLSQLDSERPLESPLLHNAHSAHGGAESAAIPKSDSKQWQLLAAWLSSMRVSTHDVKPTTIVEPNELLMQTPGGRLPPASDQESAVDAVARPAAAQSYQPVDPFDAEVFNRRYHSAERPHVDGERP